MKSNGSHRFAAFLRESLLLCSLLAAGLWCATVKASPLEPEDQTGVVHVGKGSYAASVPDNADGVLRKFEAQPVYLVHPDNRPLPSNKWWTQLLVSRYAKSLWTYPLRIEAGEEGIDVCFPTKWNESGSDPVCDFPLRIGARNFKPIDSRANNWSDWLVSFRMQDSNDNARYMDVTLGEGMPAIWIETKGLEPQIHLPIDSSECRFFDLKGEQISLPTATDAIGLQYKGRAFAIFAPDGTSFQRSGSVLNVGFTAVRRYLIVCSLPDPRAIAEFHRYAFAIPRSTQFSWKFHPEAGSVETTWKIDAEPLKGTQRQVVQGWIPHHYRDTVNDIKMNGMDYLSPRGKLKCSVGNEFHISYPYYGVVPNLPAPTVAPRSSASSSAYSSARMHSYLEMIASKPHFGDDTYWGGKDILRFGQCALMAQLTSDPTLDRFRVELRQALANWYTYTPGEKNHYFAAYPGWKALVGVNPSYGSEGFNDHHFHYGYFTFATALMGMHDAHFLADYGEMATLVAREYANWDRTDNRFPFLRTFDIWAGHSWAGGTSSPGGENQESSSEAVQSWAGLIFLGEALGDHAMSETGIMGYAIESRATMDYWFNQGGDTFPKEWKHSITGMIWSGGKLYGTYFTGDPAWIYAIQWLPSSPMLSYLVRDPAFAAAKWDNMVSDYNAHEISEADKPENQAKGYRAKTASIKEFGAALGNVMLGYRMMYDPDWTTEQLDHLWREPGDTIAHNSDEMAVIYYQAHAMRTLGAVAWSRRTSSPTSMVYFNAKTGSYHYIVWNPGVRAETVDVFENQKRIGRILCAPQALTTVSSLLPAP